MSQYKIKGKISMDEMMIKKAREITKDVKGYDCLTIHAIPTWENEMFTDFFDISFYASNEEDENGKHLKPIHIHIYELIDLLIELRCLHIDNYKVNIFTYYHGCIGLIDFYSSMIKDLDCYNGFRWNMMCMEY
jgi:hypothetical protein